MVICGESGSLRIQRPDIDRGTFTVQATDIPISCLRRTHRKAGTIQPNQQRKKVRLTPINECEETLTRDASFTSRECAHNMAPIRIALTSPCGDYTYITREGSFERSDTPMLHRKSSSTKLYVDIDTFEEELETITTIDESEVELKDPTIANALAELPPRPKCKRKVLPPSVTTVVDNGKPKKKKLLKLRSRHENSIENASYALPKDLQYVMKRQTLQALSKLPRPRSAEHVVRVIRLADLSSANSSSVPDLPSILNNIAKSNELAEVSSARNVTHTLSELSRGRTLTHASSEMSRGSGVTKSAMYEDSGALSTPRNNSDSQLENGSPMSRLDSEVKVENCLKGSDIASFYNMWDRDWKSRPFDKKESDKFKINIHRDCLCAIRNCAKKCVIKRNNVLPPINSPSRDI